MRTTLGRRILGLSGRFHWTSSRCQISTAKRRLNITSNKLSPGLNVGPKKGERKWRQTDGNRTNLCRVGIPWVAYVHLFHVHSCTCLDELNNWYAAVKISNVWILRKYINKTFLTRNFSFSKLTHLFKPFAPYTSIFFRRCRLETFF